MKVEPDLRTIGVVAAPHGLQGTVKINPLSDFPERYYHLKTCFLRRQDGSLVKTSVKTVKLAARQVLITFDSIGTREEAEALRGSELCISEEERWELPENTYYVSDLLGFKAVSEEGEILGELAEVMRGAQDVFRIMGPRGELLVPFVDAWVGEINVQQKTILIRDWQSLQGIEPETRD